MTEEKKPRKGVANVGTVVRDQKTVEGFGYQWSKFDQSSADEGELSALFDAYFRIFPWDALPASARGIDLGCGTGRWARYAARRVGSVICVDPSDAVAVAKRNLRDVANCQFLQSAAGELPLAPASLDFGYSLGVLHHTPDPLRALQDATAALKPGAPFLLYLYYALDNRPAWFRAVWRVSDVLRRLISRVPVRARYVLSQVVAIAIYWPLARLSRLLESHGRDASGIPLYAYRDKSLYVLRTDALDQFGTAVEERFTATEIRNLMASAGLERITVGDELPYWCAVGYRVGTG